MKIVLDAFGGDNAPGAIVRGGVAALAEFPDFGIIFTGKKDEIEKILDDCCAPRLRERIEIIDCDECITNDESPTAAIRQKKNSSLVVGMRALKERDDVQAFVSAGSTGAILTGGVLILGRIKGISRPSLAPILPTVTDGNVILIDCGANADCKPVNLVHFAVMGSNYMKSVHGIKNPRVALLSNGTEDHKGNMLTQETFGILKNIECINFTGNMEARDILSGNYDVVVADGFNGNVALKSLEGMSGAMVKLIKRGIKESFTAKIGALFMKKVFASLKAKLDYTSAGGAIFLGVNGVVIKAHGSSKEDAIKGAVLQARSAVSDKVVENIAQSLASIDFDNLVKAEEA